MLKDVVCAHNTESGCKLFKNYQGPYCRMFSRNNFSQLGTTVHLSLTIIKIGSFFWNDITQLIRDKPSKKMFRKALSRWYLAQY